MDCPKCGSDMQKRSGKHGEFMFCPMQYQCGHKTMTIRKVVTETTGSMNHLEAEFLLMGNKASPMARMLYEKVSDFERENSYDYVDPADVVFGSGLFVNGPYEDDEDAILW